MGPTWGPPGSCRPQLGPMLAPWTLLLGISWKSIPLIMSCSQLWNNYSVTRSFINHWYGYYGMMYSINYAMFKSTTYQLYAKIDNLRDVIICLCLKTHKTSGVSEWKKSTVYEFRVRTIHLLHIKQWNVITHPWSNFGDGLTGHPTSSAPITRFTLLLRSVILARS